MSITWKFPQPHITEWHIGAEHIDHYGHANNVAYLAQQEKTAWSHSNAIGLTVNDFKTKDRAMVVTEHHVKYLQPCSEHDTVLCGTWITNIYKKLMLTRNFQFICSRRGTTVFESASVFVCAALSTGRPMRIPTAFLQCYRNANIGAEK